MMHTEFLQTNLEYRLIERGNDKDYFIETLSYPVNMDLKLPYMSRIQFPKSRAVLVRTAPFTSIVTIHIMRDVDLQSSFSNFEVDLTGKVLNIIKQEGYIEFIIK